MQSLILARVIHVIAVVFWIGGVAMVTTVILPMLLELKTAEQQLSLFETIENRFARQARFITLLAGASGFYMLYSLDAWGRYALLQYWWLHAMTLIWLIYTLLLFVLEPLVLHRKFRESVLRNPTATFTLALRVHWVLLILSLITIAGAVAGSHGWPWS